MINATVHMLHEGEWVSKIVHFVMVRRGCAFYTDSLKAGLPLETEKDGISQANTYHFANKRRKIAAHFFPKKPNCVNTEKIQTLIQPRIKVVAVKKLVNSFSYRKAGSNSLESFT